MELKKSPKADLEKRRSTFLLTGFMIAMCLPIALFSWSTNEKQITSMDIVADPVDTELAPIPIPEPEQPKVEKAKVPVYISDGITIVNNSKELTVEPDIFGEGDPIPLPSAKEFGKSSGGETEYVDPTPRLVADEMPIFNGKSDKEALEEFRKWVQSNLRYPADAEDIGISGTVVLKFVVERDGSIKDVEVLRGAHSSLDKAAINQVLNSPQWTPGKNKGKAVRIMFTLPVVFKIQ